MKPYEEIDIFFAGDVVYDKELIERLVQIFKILKCNASKKKQIAFIASTIRNEATFQLFLNKIEEARIPHQIAPTVPIKRQFQYPQGKIAILQLDLTSMIHTNPLVIS